MSKIVAIKHAEVMKRLLNTPEAVAAYQEAMEEDALLEQLTEWRENAGLTKAEVAKRMGVNPPAINRLERNVTKASYHTLKRYAAACGINMTIVAANK
ncbi:helix-turn-helix domain-containing protein [Sodalis ligni]|jgi:HTH-type transcriptional regulator/antitoxin HipB|uniref:Helix-turn-helix protein n=1 Tax=Sodalis ligni TaxID=2697027 RepID=A0A4V2Q3F4_9GAMM|nr:helix-turn-helix protein [Sodalis ligni]